MHSQIKLTFLGDILCQMQMLDAYRQHNGFNFDSIFAPSINLLKESDFVIANLETPISENNTNLTSAPYSFNAPFEFAKSISSAGINCVSTANNHCLDRGIEGISSTIRSLNKIGLLHTGCFDNPNKNFLITNINGIRLGIMSYTYGTNAFANHTYLSKKDYWRVNLFQNQELSFPLDRYSNQHPNSIISKAYQKFLQLKKSPNINRPVYERNEFSYSCRKKLLANIKKTKEQSPDFIIMLMHTGGQYNDSATEETKKLTSFLLENGIDIVCGNHEHLVHGGVFSKIGSNKIATYSLGNFCSLYGSFEKPFEKMADYSIAWHLYLEKEKSNAKIAKTSFSIIQNVKDSSANYRIKSIPLYNLYIQSPEIQRKKILDTANKISLNFCNKPIKKIESEFFI